MLRHESPQPLEVTACPTRRRLRRLTPTVQAAPTVVVSDTHETKPHHSFQQLPWGVTAGAGAV